MRFTFCLLLIISLTTLSAQRGAQQTHYPSNVSAKTVVPGDISGSVFYDIDENGMQDINEPGVPNIRVLANGIFAAYTDSLGNYNIYLSSIGDYVLTISAAFILADNYYTTTTYPITESVLVIPGTNSASFGIGFQVADPQLNLEQLIWDMEPLSEFLLYTESSAAFPIGADSVIFEVLYDGLSLEYMDSDIPTIFDSQGVLSWTRTVDSAFPVWSESHRFLAGVSLPDSLTFSMSAFTYTDGSVSDFYSSYSITPSAEFLANDITVSPAGMGDAGVIPLDTERLWYTIRFQNTGPDSVMVLSISDSIDIAHLDMSGFQMNGTSHPEYTLSYSENELQFLFDPIILPSNSENILASQGFVRFSIPLSETVAVGDVIENQATIQFDSLPEVITQTVQNTLEYCAMAEISATDLYCTGDELSGMSVQGGGTNTWSIEGFGTFQQQEIPTITFNDEEVLWLVLSVEDELCMLTTTDSLELTIYEVPTSSPITQNGNLLNVVTTYSIQWYLEGAPITNATSFQIEIIEDGNYTVLFSNGICSVLSPIFYADYSGLDDLVLSGTVRLSYDHAGIELTWNPELGIDLIRLFDMMGREIVRASVDAKETYRIETSSLPTGHYVLLFEGEDSLLGMSRYVQLR